MDCSGFHVASDPYDVRWTVRLFQGAREYMDDAVSKVITFTSLLFLELQRSDAVILRCTSYEKHRRTFGRPSS
jgi:hypothetical protein